MEKLTICIPTANYSYTLKEAIDSIGDYPYKLIRDNTGCGNCLNHFLSLDSEILFFLCDDDVLISPNVIEEVIRKFDTYPLLGVLGRYYYWFDKDPQKPIRYKVSNNIYALSDQISGMAFRRKFMKGKFSNEPFIEMASMVKNTLERSSYDIIESYTVAVRTTQSGSCNPKVYEKSPTKRWISVCGNQKFISTNFVGLVQIRLYGGLLKALKESFLLLSLRPLNVLDLRWWLFTLLIFLPKKLLKWLSYNFKLIWRPKF